MCLMGTQPFFKMKETNAVKNQIDIIMFYYQRFLVILIVYSIVCIYL